MNLSAVFREIIFIDQYIIYTFATKRPNLNVHLSGVSTQSPVSGGHVSENLRQDPHLEYCCSGFWSWELHI